MSWDKYEPAPCSESIGVGSVADGESWQILDLMFQLGERGGTIENVWKGKMKQIFKVKQLTKCLDNPQGSPMELYRKGLYNLLCIEPLYMPTISLTIYWPDDGELGSHASCRWLPCMVAFASKGHNVVLDLLPLGRSMASVEALGQALSYTDACVRALALVQMVLEDHSTINIVTWDRSDLQRAQHQLFYDEVIRSKLMAVLGREPQYLTSVGDCLKVPRSLT